MPDKRHYPGGVISVACDEDQQVRCYMCDAIVPSASMTLLLRTEHDQAWSAFCLDCAIDFAASAIAARLTPR